MATTDLDLSAFSAQEVKLARVMADGVSEFVTKEISDITQKSGLMYKSLNERIGETKKLAIATQRGIDALRKGAQPGRPGLDPSGLIRLFTAAVRAKAARQSVEDYLAANPDHLTARFKDLVASRQPMVFKAVTNPAMSTVVGWASELAMGRTLAPLAALAPTSAYGQLQGRSSVLPLSFEGVAQIILPSRTRGDLAGGFHSEAAPLPVKRSTLTSRAVLPYSYGSISTFTKEMSRSQNFESIVRTEIEADTLVALDTAFLSDDAATPIAPAGVLNNAVVVPPSAASVKLEACAEDLGALSAAIPNAYDLVYISQADVRARATIYAGAGASAIPWIVTPAAPAGAIVAIDAASLAMVESGFDFSIAEEAAIHEETEPLPISTGTSGAAAITAAPVRSLWQTDCLGIRLFSFVSWALRGPGRAAVVSDIVW